MHLPTKPGYLCPELSTKPGYLRIHLDFEGIHTPLEPVQPAPEQNTHRGWNHREVDGDEDLEGAHGTDAIPGLAWTEVT